MSLKVFSFGPKGASHTDVASVGQVAAVVQMLRSAGHMAVRVGTVEGRALAYDEWSVMAQGMGAGRARDA